MKFEASASSALRLHCCLAFLRCRAMGETVAAQPSMSFDTKESLMVTVCGQSPSHAPCVATSQCESLDGRKNATHLQSTLAERRRLVQKALQYHLRFSHHRRRSALVARQATTERQLNTQHITLDVPAHCARALIPKRMGSSKGRR